MNISGSNIMLTGATGGIGHAIAQQLAQRGAHLIPIGRDINKLAVLEAELKRLGALVTPLAGDLVEGGIPQRLVSAALKRVGRIDILINCAGVQNFGHFSAEKADATTTLLNTNIIAPIALTNAVLPDMLQRGRGKIVNVGSIFGSIGFPLFASYSASKFALRGFSEALRRELAHTGISVNYIAPRFTRTALNRQAVVRMAGELKMNQDEPEVVAHSVIKTIERNSSESYLGWPEKLFVRINSIFPGLVDSSLIKQCHQMQPFALETNQ